MTWLILTLLSALCLGFYDVAKKVALRDNAVPPVLMLSVLVGATIWVPVIVASAWYPQGIPWDLLQVDRLKPADHGLLLIKSALVGASWALAYVGLKLLPISIASPIRSSSPLWTILIATVGMGERPSAVQWVGVVVVLGAFYAFSFVGRREGIHFYRDKGVACMLAAALLAAMSATYDKYLLQNRNFDVATVQAWFSIYLVPVVAPLFVYWYRWRRRAAPLHPTHAIWAIAIFLTISDFLYFNAIRQPGALIALITPLRRTSVIVTFAAGAGLFGEPNISAKTACILVLLAGVYLLSLS